MQHDTQRIARWLLQADRELRRGNSRKSQRARQLDAVAPVVLAAGRDSIPGKTG